MENSKVEENKLDPNTIDIVEGTVSFWIRKEIVKYDDDKVYFFVNINNPQGAIFILKDSDQRLKFHHVYYDKGKTTVEIDVKDLDSNDKHFIAATWSLSKKEINLFIDGDKKIAKQLIKY